MNPLGPGGRSADPDPLRSPGFIKDSRTILCPRCHGEGGSLHEGSTRPAVKHPCPMCIGTTLITAGWASSIAVPGLQHIVRVTDLWRWHQAFCGLTIRTPDLHVPQGPYCSGCVVQPTRHPKRSKKSLPPA